MPFEARKFREPDEPIGFVSELFAGVGGFRIGLAEAGWKTIFSNQWEPATKSQQASNVYEARFGSDGHTNIDVASVEELPPSTDLLVGGFPCQDYSVAKSANSAKGIEGKKGVLWWEILRLVKGQRPKFIFLENVDRLLKSPSTQRGRDFAIMLKTLGDAGYLIEWRVVNAAEYGFAQRRIRVFIVARRLDGLGVDWQFSPHETLFNNGILARALPIRDDKTELKKIDLSQAADVISKSFNSSGGKSPFENCGVFHKDAAHTIRVNAVDAAASAKLGDVILPDADVPPEYWVPENRLSEWEYLKGAKSIERTHAGGGKYVYSEGKMAFPDLLTNPSRTILTGEGGASPSRFKHIIRTEKGYRRLTPIELERLNGFPDDWTRTGLGGEIISDARRAFFMGNALVIGLVELVGAALAEEHSRDK
jgi:DNA (cytosine-5)-methyltransferase 1